MKIIKKTISILLVISLVGTFCMFAVSADSTEPTAKYIAITFDDGPNNSTCIDMLDILKKYNVPATFFTIGQNCNASTADTLKRMVSQNCEIGMHGFNHTYEGGWTIEQINADLQKCSDAVYNLAGVRPELFRLPFLNMPSSDVASQIQYPLIAGGGPADYNGSSTQSRIDGLLNEARDGQIFLCHCFEGNANTVEAMDTVIPELLKQGYTFVTVSDMFAIKGITPTLGVQYQYVADSSKIVLPKEYYGLYESEKTCTRHTTSTTRSTQTDTEPFNIKYISTTFTAENQIFEFVLPDVEAGEYTLYVYSRDDKNGATANLTVNGDVNLGDTSFKSKFTDYLPHKANDKDESYHISVSETGDVTLLFTSKTTGSMNFDKFLLISDTPEPDYLLGDANSDTNIDIKDLLIIKKYTVKITVPIDLKAADVNKDDEVNIKDMLLIKKYIVKIITSF